jgi:hypothetical protein
MLVVLLKCITLNDKDNKRFIFTKGNKYIGYDSHSGGYPYETDSFMRVKVWYTKEQALRYGSNFKDKGWQLRELHGLDFSLPLDN